MHPELSFDQAPPISVPYRFFLVAPWFGVLGGLLLFWSGPDLLASRWTPEALALTHLISVGFMLQSMCGALLQFIPVAVGGNVWRPVLVANLVQPLLVLAAFLLVSGFAFGQPVMLAAAAPLFVVGIGALAAVVAVALWRTPATGMTLGAMRLSIAGLLVTTILGAILAEALAAGWPLPFADLTNVHLAWGLGGWALMLLVGVSYQVVPMFQLTRAYPPTFSRWFAPLLLLLLVAWSSRLISELTAWQVPVGVALLFMVSAYAATTLWLQATRRRKISDATSVYFRIAMLSALGFAASGFALAWFPELGNDPRTDVWMGVLAFVGVFVSTISGMLYKIVPFLNWLHLQRLGAPLSAVPNMRKMLAADAMTAQMRLHVLCLGLLLAAVWVPALSRPAGLAMAGAFAWLGLNLVAAVRRYQEFRDQILATALHR